MIISLPFLIFTNSKIIFMFNRKVSYECMFEFTQIQIKNISGIVRPLSKHGGYRTRTIICFRRKRKEMFVLLYIRDTSLSLGIYLLNLIYSTVRLISHLYNILYATYLISSETARSVQKKTASYDKKFGFIPLRSTSTMVIRHLRFNLLK